MFSSPQRHGVAPDVILYILLLRTDIVELFGIPETIPAPDVRIVPQHTTVAPSQIEAAGRVLLGLDPGTNFF